ncbi:MAG: DUF167 domain-containing protein [Patescibacteria group bacterium]
MRQILVEVKPNSAKNQIEKISDSVYKVKLTAPPQEGKANKLLIELLSQYFNIAKSQIEIKSGKTSKNKVLIIYG